MLKEIDLAGALARIRDGKNNVCMLVPVSRFTTIENLMDAEGFVLVGTVPEEPEPKPEKPKAEKKKVDTGKILALHRAGWTASQIALEIGCSVPTVCKYINAEKNNAEA